jgi:hypothetical protein
MTDRNHSFFQKDYLPPKRQSMVFEELKVNNDDGFFTGLPESTKHKGSRRGNVNMLLTQQQKDELKLKLLQSRATAANQRLQVIQDKVGQNILPQQVQQ